MSPKREPNASASRDQARARVRSLTRVALLATTGATVGIGVVVAHEHRGTSAASSTTSGKTTGGGTATTPSSSSSGNTGSTSTGSTGNTGNTGASSSAPSSTTQAPAVTSGGTSRR